MGNTPSNKRATSPFRGEDALEALDNSVNLHHSLNSSGKNENSCSLNSFLDVNQGLMDEDVAFDSIVCGQVESPDQLNFVNLQASFLSSVLTTQVKTFQFQPLYNVVNAHRFSLYCQEYVTMCASFILSTLKVYGQCVPQDARIINEKSRLMFHILNNLQEFLCNMKLSHWHFDYNSWRESVCVNCDIKKVLFQNIAVKNIDRNASFCVVCVRFISKEDVTTHIMTVGHRKVKEKLLEEIYPLACHKCQSRFCKENDLQLHLCQHNSDSAVNNEKKDFKPLCCYLCRIALDNETELGQHISTSIEHGLRKEIAMELNLRRKIASQHYSPPAKVNTSLEEVIEDQINVEVELQSSSIHTTVKKSMKKEQKSEENGLFSRSFVSGTDTSSDIACNSTESQYFCWTCQAKVPKANKVEHETGNKHQKLFEASGITSGKQFPECSLGERKQRRCEDKIEAGCISLLGSQGCKGVLSDNSKAEIRNLGPTQSVVCLSSVISKDQFSNYSTDIDLVSVALESVVIEDVPPMEHKVSDNNDPRFLKAARSSEESNLCQTWTQLGSAFSDNEGSVAGVNSQHHGVKKLINFDKMFLSSIDLDGVGTRYRCTLCYTKSMNDLYVEDYGIAVHLLGAKHVLLWSETQTLSVMEERLKIVSSLQGYNVSDKAIAKGVSRLENLIHERRETVKKRKQSEHDFEQSKEKEMTECGSTTTSNNSLQETKILDQTSTSNKPESPKNNIERKKSSLESNSSTNTKDLVVEETLHFDENDPLYDGYKHIVIKEVLVLEKDLVSPIDLDSAKYWCSMCSVECSNEQMLVHVLGESHLSQDWAAKRTTGMIEERLRMLIFYQTWNVFKSFILKAILRLQNFIQERTSDDSAVLVNITTPPRTIEMEQSRKETLSTSDILSVEDSLCNVSVGSEDRNNYVCSSVIVSADMKSTRTVDRDQKYLSQVKPHELVKMVLALEESVVCSPKGLVGKSKCSLCFIECECNAMVVHVLNENHLKLWSKNQTLQSMETKLKVFQNLKSYNMYKKALDKAMSTVEEFIKEKNEEMRKVNEQILEDNKEKVKDQVLMLEGKFLMISHTDGVGRRCWCSLCSVECDDNAMVLHLLEETHLSHFWAKSHTLHTMNETLQHLTSLQRYNVYQSSISQALERIQFLIQHKKMDNIAESVTHWSNDTLHVEDDLTAVYNRTEAQVNGSTFVKNRLTTVFDETLGGCGNGTVSKAQESAHPDTIVQKFLTLEENFIRPAKKGRYICSLCSLSCGDSEMVFHILGKKHLSDKWSKSHTLEVMEKKLEILSHLHTLTLELIEKKKVDPYFQTIIGYESFIRKAKTRIQNLMCIERKKEAAQVKLPTSVPETVLNINQSNENRYDEDSTSRNAIVIGDSLVDSLQDEFLQACGNRDCDDFEVECGICGALFPIYNGDIDISLDMHVQNDAQHTLATAVPLERDAQNMSEISKTKTSSPKNYSNETSVCHKLIEKHAGKKKVYEEILQLESSYVSAQNSQHYCKLCSVLIKTESGVIHHCLKHMSEKWASDHTTEMLQKKYKKIQSLMALKYAGSFIESTLKRIADFISERNKHSYKSKLNAASKKGHTTPVSVNPCAVKSELNIRSRVIVPSSSTKSNSLCEICHKSPAEMNVEDKKKHKILCKKDPAELFFCDTCKLLMEIGNRRTHFKGKMHMKNNLGCNS